MFFVPDMLSRAQKEASREEDRFPGILQKNEQRNNYDIEKKHFYEMAEKDTQ